MRHCVLCKKKQNGNGSFFNVPKDERLKQMWIKSCQIHLKASSYVCEDHFAPTDMIKGGRNFLLPHAVPSIGIPKQQIQNISTSLVTICGYSCHTNVDLLRHLRKHTEERPFKCKYCTGAFGDRLTLAKHERVHRKERPFQCDICSMSFSYSTVLKRHKLIHTGEKPYKCEICEKSFTARHHLRSHLKTMQHQNDPRVETLLQNIRKNKEDEI